MRVFYRGPRAVITEELITIAHALPCSFAIAELSAVYIVRQQLRSSPEAYRTMGVSALVGGVLTVPIIGPASKALAVVVVLMMIVYAVVCFRFGPSAHHQLVATHDGRRVVVFESDDQREFDQVCRGMQRALESLG